MSDYGARRACLIRAYEPSLRREVQLGKIVPVTTRAGLAWMYVNNVNTKLIIGNSWGIAVPVVRLMERWHVTDALYFWGGDPYIIGLVKILELHPWTPGRKPPYYQIPIAKWHTPMRGWIGRVPMTDDVITLAWDEPDKVYGRAMAEQLAML